MRNWLIIIVSVVLSTTLPVMSRSAQNPSIRNLAGSSTRPASSISSGLIRSPDPIYRSGNLTVTGNVRRGRHFRGSVPYRASTSFEGTLGSTSLDSFLRDSVGTKDLRNYPRSYRPQPYYSPTGTVTTTTPGRPGVFTPAKVDSRTTGTSGLKVTPQAIGSSSLSLQNQEGAFLAQGTKASDYDLRALRISPRELERLISDGVAVAGRARRLVDEEDLAQMERLRRDLEQLKLRASDLRESLVVRDDSQRPFNKLKLDKEKEVLRPIKPQVTKEMAEETPAFGLRKPLQDQEQLDLHERLRQQLDSLQETLALQSAAQQAEKTADEKKRPSEEKLYPKTFREPIVKEDKFKRSLKFSREEISELDMAKQLSELPEAKTDVSVSPDTNLSTRAKRILSEYKTFTSFLDDKFSQHIITAEVYLKQGKYYQAVDAYTLASIYKPDDQLSCAGKSQALFAAGEYMSSSLFLSRALKISPEQARVKVDFVAILGGEDKLETRIADVEEWLQRSNAAELEFLLGYVYYQMGKLQDAQKAINAAYEKDPKSPAVGVVKQAIEDALK